MYGLVNRIFFVLFCFVDFCVVFSFTIVLFCCYSQSCEASKEIKKQQNTRLNRCVVRSHAALTHWDEMAGISQTTFSNPLSSMNIIQFCFQFHLICSEWFNWVNGTIWIYDYLLCWRINASFGPTELKSVVNFGLTHINARVNDRYFADDIFKSICEFEWNCSDFDHISLKFCAKCPFDNLVSLV